MAGPQDTGCGTECEEDDGRDDAGPDEQGRFFGLGPELVGVEQGDGRLVGSPGPPGEVGGDVAGQPGEVGEGNEDGEDCQEESEDDVVAVGAVGGVIGQGAVPVMRESRGEAATGCGLPGPRAAG
ncbi:hypothetical protein GCM10010344_53300 [Streptomyces bluensis]|nr:hypothetical protein GCM10010344_53300 [Streptomyces bluensis]